MAKYFLMAAFCWMLIEGIYLYLLVVKVYNITEKIHVSRHRMGYKTLIVVSYWYLSHFESLLIGYVIP